MRIAIAADKVPILIEKDGYDILQDRKVNKGELVLAPYQVAWIA